MAATPTDQLIVHTHRLSLALPHQDAESQRDAVMDYRIDLERPVAVAATGEVRDAEVDGEYRDEAVDFMATDAQPASPLARSSHNHINEGGWGHDVRCSTPHSLCHKSLGLPSPGRIDDCSSARSDTTASACSVSRTEQLPRPSLEILPTEVIFHILNFLDVYDLLSTSRVNHLLRSVSVSPVLHHYRLRNTRYILPPLLYSPARPSIENLISRQIFLTHTNVVSRRLARSLVSIRLSRRLAARPSPKTLVERAVLPRECVPGMANVYVAPGLVARRKTIEKERLKDSLRRWVESKWRREVLVREEDARHCEEVQGVGRVWRLTRFWERKSRGDVRLLS